MGITGLLPLLKKASTNCHVRKFSGCTVAIDAYVWLHKGAFGCAAKLGTGEPTTAYITYCVKYINVLLEHNIKPVVVLDGRNLPSKSETEKKRRAKREQNRKNAKEFLRKGMKKEAWECFTRCVDITPAMAREFIKVLRDMKIDYIVAPYEADAQLAYLARNNIVDVVITEDSDLVLFGCPKIFFKMSVDGSGVLFDQSKLGVCMGVKSQKFEFQRFRWMCIISGCDYLASLPGIGLGRAKKLMDLTTSHDIRVILKSIPSVLRLDVDVTEEYIQGFIQAENTFLYQLVFDTLSRRLVPLTPYSADIEHKNMPYAGAYVEKKLALDMALGNVDIHTLNKVDNFDPMKPNTGYKNTSIWSKDFTPSTTPRLITAREMKKTTKHSSTVGMQANISVGSAIKKQNIKVKLENPEDQDEKLLNLYSSTDDPIETEKQLIPDEKYTKRRRLPESSEDSDDDFMPQHKSEKGGQKRNPFLKAKKSTSDTKENIKLIKGVPLYSTAEPTANPICLIERNKIYDQNSKIIVKSQYFRDEVHCRNSFEFISKPKLQKANFDIYASLSEDEVLKTELDEETESSQLTIYSVGDEDQNLSDEEELDEKTIRCIPVTSSKLLSPKTNYEPPTICLDSNSGLPTSDEIKSRLRISSQPIRKSPRRNASKHGKFLGPCHRIGLSKSKSGIKKIDPKQKTISAMFSAQSKAKM